MVCLEEDGHGVVYGIPEFPNMVHIFYIISLVPKKNQNFKEIDFG